jgi:putative ATPase
LLSRSQVYVLKPLDASSLQKIIEIIGVPSINRASIAINSEARDLLVEHADGDGRRLINATSAVLNAAQTQKVAAIDAAFVQRSLGAQLRRFDKGGDQFYDQISALHKSVRGSDPDAALYWFCRMLDGGADPRYLARRILRMATEDIGLADPRALTMALEAMQAYERLGSPEGELMLAQAVVFLSVAPKSNAVYAAFNAAKALVKTDASRAVPLHLRNAPTALMKSLDFGKNYRYAHNEPDAVAAGENYWPDGLPAQSFYQPTPRGLEIKIGERLAEIRAKLSPKAP